MKLSFIKKYTTLIICCTLLLTSVQHINTFAALEDIAKLGGSYEQLLELKNKYLDRHPDDTTEYECHYLISKQALNRWGTYIRTRYGENRYNYFLTNDEWQEWAPTIIMEKADHEKTLSHINNSTAVEYIDTQAHRLIYDGDIVGVLHDEIEFIQQTFDHKYDRAIREVLRYINTLGFIYPNPTTLIMNNPDNYYWYFEYHFNQ